MQCKDIPDLPILQFLAGPYDGWPVPGWGTWFWGRVYKPENSVVRAMPEGIPAKLVRAKMAMLIRRGLVDGCSCGCRGDYELTSKGEAYLASRRNQQGEIAYDQARDV